MSTIGKIAAVLVIIGALNWGLVSIGYNLVDAIFGEGSTLSTIIYALVGISGIIGLLDLVKGKGGATM